MAIPLAAHALSALRAATSECAATAGSFSPEECAEGVALATELRDLFISSTVAAAANCQPPSLPHLPTELLLQVVRHLDVRDLGRLAGTGRLLYFGPPCPPRPTSVMEEELRRRAAKAGRWLPSSPPAGVSGWVRALLQREWRDSPELGTVAAEASLHIVFVDANGALLVSGFEYQPGTLGLPRDQDGNATELRGRRTVLVPTPVPSMAGIRIRHVAASCCCSLAVSEAGRVYMWGAPYSGRLAPESEDRLMPTLIPELSHHRVRQVAMEVDLCAAVTEEGLLFTWAPAAWAPVIPFPNKAEQMRPVLGLGLAGTTVSKPRPPQCVTALKKERVGSVAVGSRYMLVTTEAGGVYSFGEGAQGNLGHGDRETHILPKRVQALGNFYVATVAAAGVRSFALTACGRVFWWGPRIGSENRSGDQLLPQLVDSAFGGERVRSIAARYSTVYAVTAACVLFRWGCDTYALDLRAIYGADVSYENCLMQLSPMPVAALHVISVVDVSTRRHHAFVLAADGSVYGMTRPPKKP
jgi:alpha-tubulin suppressor-like RCC1 family protein